MHSECIVHYFCVYYFTLDLGVHAIHFYLRLHFFWEKKAKWRPRVYQRIPHQDSSTFDFDCAVVARPRGRRPDTSAIYIPYNQWVIDSLRLKAFFIALGRRKKSEMNRGGELATAGRKTFRQLTA